MSDDALHALGAGLALVTKGGGVYVTRGGDRGGEARERRRTDRGRGVRRVCERGRERMKETIS